MTLRIALSSLLILILAVACDPNPAADADPVADLEQHGVGTSPSAAAQASPLSPYGIWVDVTEAAADARALAGEEPDLVVLRGDHVTGSDAIAVAAWRWPGQHVVRELILRPPRWTAVQAP
jgi:fermentation-respiration switch protein FrsA (DUF1100 family)